MQGFAWLDDLAAVGDAAARDRAQDWVWSWIALYGGGTGPGWTPDLTGRRLIRWISHAIFLLRAQGSGAVRRDFYQLAGAADHFSVQTLAQDGAGLAAV